jgi:hypothetical protein
MDAPDSPEAEEAELAGWDAAEAEIAGADAFFGASPAPQDDSFAEADPGRSLEDRIVGLESAISRSEEEFEPDGSEDPADHVPRFVLRTGATRPRPGDDPAEDGPATAAAEAADGGATPDELDAELARIGLDTPDPLDEAPGVSAATEPDPFEIDPFSPAPEVAAAEAADPQSAAPEGADPEAPDPDAAPAEPPARPRRTVSENLYASAEAPDAGDIAPRGAGGTSIEEALIDEDALREIVGELVRQELRGELGERITRNVRRLIRREIHRAMSLQELAEDED